MKGEACILHLVHGTFAREAEWIQPDSSLAKAVKSRITREVTIAPFIWTGANSHSARQKAGTELAARISDYSQHQPGVPQYIIAHSHGGNVAAYALSKGETSSRVAGVACLGTPFIKAHARDLAGSRRLVQWILMAVVLMICLLVIGISTLGFEVAYNPKLVVEIAESTGPPLPSALTDANWAPYFWFGLYLLIAFAIGWGLFRLVVRLWRFFLQKEIPKVAKLQSELIERLTAVFDNTPLLIINAQNDEAAWWLSTISRLASTVYRIWKPSTFLLSGIAVLCILMFIPLISLDQSDMSRIGMMGTVAFSALGLFCVSTLLVYLGGWLLCLIVPAFVRSHALGFGKDDFLQNFIVEISSSVSPERSAQMSRETVTVSGSGLHHSRLYQEKYVMQLLSVWLEKRLTQRK